MDPLLDVCNLSVYFSHKNRRFPAVRNVSFSLFSSEIVGIVGESGSGKSAMAQALLGLSQGDVEGKIIFQNRPLVSPVKEIGIVFQDPLSALNPTMKIGRQIVEGPLYHGLISKHEAKDKAIELLKWVQLPFPEKRIEQYPHELSGGMRQRVLLAIALACSPKLLIADEPTTSLDANLQTQILMLLQDLCKQLKMALLLISHDLYAVKAICQRLLVMYAGKIVERGDTLSLLAKPRHPYTQALLSCLPQFDLCKRDALPVIEGTPLALHALDAGCPFRKRCPQAIEACLQEPPGQNACWKIADD